MNKKALFRRMKKSKFFLIGSIGLIVIILLCLLSPLYVQYDPLAPDLLMRLSPPEWFRNGIKGHILGTDALGRDILTRLLLGGRASLFIAFSVVLPSAAIGCILGMLSGYFSGVVDNVIMRFCDIMMATPSLLLAICIVAVMGSTFFNLIITLIITSWVIGARVVRGTVLALRESEYVQAAKVMGMSNTKIMFTEILPNVVTPLIINESQHFGAIILTEASMSFLGVGVPLPTPSWGSMISEGRSYIATAPWVVVVPGIALMLTVLFFNFLGDGLRDILDPKNKD